MRALAVRYAVTGLALPLIVALTSCSAALHQRTPATAGPPARETLSFGPVYPVGTTTDGVIAATLMYAETTGAPVATVEIRGYVVDMMVPFGDSGRHGREVVVMKDGSLWRLRGILKPLSFWRSVPTRHKPESAEEAQAREGAVAAARSVIATQGSGLASATPEIFAYIVRFGRSDGSCTDVYVDPDVGPNMGIWYDPPVEAFNP
ncbi:MAG: hypothetical protein FDZ70_08850 [Actinobacteria bacterium]|nr:MAG: hypothetical protein FDZ70_08850 [Actinomycetota bacterium]